MTDYQIFQQFWLDIEGYKVGDVVTVAKKPHSVMTCWTNDGLFYEEWIPFMDKFVGETYPIERITQLGIVIQGWLFPYYVLARANG